MERIENETYNFALFLISFRDVWIPKYWISSIKKTTFLKMERVENETDWKWNKTFCNSLRSMIVNGFL